MKKKDGEIDEKILKSSLKVLPGIFTVYKRGSKEFF